MKRLIPILFIFLSACGSTEEACREVDTSQAPDNISSIQSGDRTIETRTWGGCSKTYSYQTKEATDGNETNERR